MNFGDPKGGTNLGIERVARRILRISFTFLYGRFQDLLEHLIAPLIFRLVIFCDTDFVVESKADASAPEGLRL